MMWSSLPGNKEYDYKVDAANGKVLSFDYDTERRTPATSSDYIGEAKAKQIVEEAAGTTGVYSEFKLELDDGRALYEGELRSGAAMEYEFEIDARDRRDCRLGSRPGLGPPSFASTPPPFAPVLTAHRAHCRKKFPDHFGSGNFLFHF